MKLKRIFFLTSLVVALMGQSLWAMENVESTDHATVPNLVLVRQVEGFLDRAARAITLGVETPDEERKIEYFQPALNELSDAQRLLSTDLGLTGSDGQLLAAKVYFSRGSVLEKAPEQPCETPGCNCGTQYKKKAAGAYFKARLATTDASTFAALGTINPAVAAMMTGFDAVYDEFVAGTELDHAGIKARFERFDAKFEQQQQRLSVASSMAEIYAMFAQLGLSIGRGGGVSGVPFGPDRGGSVEVVAVPLGQNPFGFGGAPRGMSGANLPPELLAMLMGQRSTIQQRTPNVREIHTTLEGLDAVAAQLSGNGNQPPAGSDEETEE